MKRPRTQDRLTESEASALRSFVERVGEQSAVTALPLNVATLARAMARLPIQRPTAHLIRLRLPELRRSAA
jgi:hypothetical protein